MYLKGMLNAATTAPVLTTSQSAETGHMIETTGRASVDMTALALMRSPNTETGHMTGLVTNTEMRRKSIAAQRARTESIADKAVYGTGCSCSRTLSSLCSVSHVLSLFTIFNPINFKSILHISLNELNTVTIVMLIINGGV